MPILDKNNKKMVKKYYNFLRNSPYADLHQDFGRGKVKSDNWIDEYVYIEENDKKISTIKHDIKGYLTIINNYLNNDEYEKFLQ